MLTPPLYPLRFKPDLKTKVWGGGRIAAFKGIPPLDGPVGESWEISAVPGAESVVADGPLAGQHLSDVVHTYGAALLGRHVAARFGGGFPLLLKFIDARADLSVQVHPDNALAARQVPSGRGKTEMWYVIDAPEGASLLSGFSREITPDEFDCRVREGTITEVTARHALHPGDVFFIPAGRIHAICAGAFVAEIQQSSDITWRIYDYNRPGLDGKPRPLHVSQAREALDFKVSDDYRTHYRPVPDTEVPLVHCPFFTTTLLPLTKPFSKDLSVLDSFVTLLCVAGEGRLRVRMSGGEVHATAVRRGASLLLPSCAETLEAVPDPAAGLTLLLSGCPR